MPRLRLLHWMPAEAQAVLDVLKKAGHSIDYEGEFRSEMLREWRKSPPDAFVIDLSRLPSQGKEIAIVLRRSAATRQTPIVFCQGAQEKVAAIRKLLPDAVYCSLPELVNCVQHALENPTVSRVIPVAMMDRYRDRSVSDKLGLREGSTLCVVDPPAHVERMLGELPPRVEWVEGDADVTLCFLYEPDSVRRAISELRKSARKTKLWMLWRKKTSAGHNGVTSDAVREAGLSLGLVDYKICSVDKDWSGMLFARKNDGRRGV